MIGQRFHGIRLKKAVETAADNYFYHSWHKDQALRLIGSMTSPAERRESAPLFRQCDEYARDVLGSIKYAPWLKAYAVFAGTFKDGWIPDNYYGRVVVPKLSGDYGEVSNFKAISNRLFQTDLLPDLAYAINGILYTPSMEPIKPTELKSYLFSLSDRIVFKLDGGLQGKSVSIYNGDSFPDESFTFSNGVFQRYIIQHPFFEAFTDQSVSTIRITTVVDDEANVSCRAAYLRMPRSTDTHVRAATAVRVVVKDDGELHEKGYMPNWVATTHHPDSSRAFAHQVVPNFQGCVQACISLHQSMKFPRLIGWDLIVDSDGNVKIMEWNGGHNGIKFAEAAVGPCFADLGWQNLWKRGP